MHTHSRESTYLEHTQDGQREVWYVHGLGHTSLDANVECTLFSWMRAQKEYIPLYHRRNTACALPQCKYMTCCSGLRDRASPVLQSSRLDIGQVNWKQHLPKCTGLTMKALQIHLCRCCVPMKIPLSKTKTFAMVCAVSAAAGLRPRAVGGKARWRREDLFGIFKKKNKEPHATEWLLAQKGHSAGPGHLSFV